MKRVLMICIQSPLPPWSGSALRSWGWLRTAAQVSRIGLVTMTRTRMEAQAVETLRTSFPYVENFFAPRTRTRKVRDLWQSLVKGRPYLLQSAFEPGLLRKVKEAIEMFKPDLVQADWIGAAPYLQAAFDQGLPGIYSSHNIEHHVVQRPMENGGRLSGTARKLRQAEIDYARKADAVIALSRSEESWFQKLGCRVFYVPNALTLSDYDYSPPSPQSKPTILFIGHLNYPPNQEAVRFLVEQILPLIRKHLPQVECLIAGRSPGRRMRALQGPGIKMLSDLPDLKEVWRQGGVLLAPLCRGAGSRLKLLEAAAYGVPIVATPFAVEGLSFLPNIDYLSGKTPSELAEGCLGLLTNPEEAVKISRQARSKVKRDHSWAQYQETIRQIYESISHHHGKE